MIFLYNNGKQYGYDDLLKALNEGTYYYPYYKTSNVFSYFVNLIKALAASQPLVLLDSVINPSEIDGLDESKVNVAESIAPSSFQNIAPLGQRFLHAPQPSQSP